MLRLLLSIALVAIAPALAADVTEADLLAAAQELGRQYDTNYNGKNAAGMAGLYVPDGVLVSPGPVLRGREALAKYYQSRFDAGAHGHATTISETHQLGDGGYGIGQFTVMAPTPTGETRELHGNLSIVYRHGADGWHLALVAASVPPPPPK
jgi:uncharacterized protein (TIGR02246 family)